MHKTKITKVYCKTRMQKLLQKMPKNEKNKKISKKTIKIQKKY